MHLYQGKLGKSGGPRYWLQDIPSHISGPYGGFIAYLDLSVLWNHWLGFAVTDEMRAQEAIVGGERGHTEDHYKQSLARSVETCFRLLKPDRWFSIVFQHWDTTYFATILETARECGGELKAAITQTGSTN